MADMKERAQGTEAQQEFRNAGNANVIRQAGEGLDSAGSATPVPGNRLTTAEVRAEVGRSPHEGKREMNGPAGQVHVDSEAKAEEREALRRQEPAEADSDLQRPEGSTALVDPVITSNPD